MSKFSQQSSALFVLTTQSASLMHRTNQSDSSVTPCWPIIVVLGYELADYCMHIVVVLLQQMLVALAVGKAHVEQHFMVRVIRRCIGMKPLLCSWHPRGLRRYPLLRRRGPVVGRWCPVTNGRHPVAGWRCPRVGRWSPSIGWRSPFRLGRHILRIKIKPLPFANDNL